MKRLLSICPSRIRPKILVKMLGSYYANRSEGSDIIVYISDDDPTINEYKEVLKNTSYIIGKRKYIVEVCNEIALNKCKEYPYMQIINDDHFIETSNFDSKLIDVIEKQGGGWGIACPIDKLTDWNKFKHPSAEIISSNIVKTLGYYIYPKLQHIGTDGYLGSIGEGVDRLFRVEDVVIRHDHWIVGRAYLDDNYRYVYNKDTFNYGMTKLAEYKKTQLNKDIEKLKQAMKGE